MKAREALRGAEQSVTAAESPILFRVLGKVGLQTRSEPHTSRLQHPPLESAVPVWVFGFPRTGTTTAQTIIAQAFSYNACFEPFSESHAKQQNFARAHELFLGRPTEESWSRYVTPKGVNSALSTLAGTPEGNEKRLVFENYIDALYAKFGRNTVFKDIRLFGNLDAVDEYHWSRGIPWACVCMNDHPLRPLYTYYRIGALCARGSDGNYPEFVYRYRIATYARLGLYEELRSLNVCSIADKLVVACLLDQAHMRAFAASRKAHCITTDLSGLSETLPTLSEWTGIPVAHDDTIKITASKRFAGDVLFERAILRELSPQVREAVSNAGHPIPTRPAVKYPSFRQLATYLRFRLYE
jgi:hypothetical protein